MTLNSAGSGDIKWHVIQIPIYVIRNGTCNLRFSPGADPATGVLQKKPPTFAEGKKKSKMKIK